MNLESDRAVNARIYHYQSGLGDWKLQCGEIGFGTLVQTLQDWQRDLWSRFFPKTFQGKRLPEPRIVFSFERKRSENLGSYHPQRSSLGLLWLVNINPANLSWMTDLQLVKVLVHLLLHCWDDLRESKRRSNTGYHSSALRALAKKLGVSCAVRGCWSKAGCLTEFGPDSPFLAWARERGLKGTPVLVHQPEPEPDRSPKRVAWICECPKADAVTLYAPTGSTLAARCERCGVLFSRKKPAVPPSWARAGASPGKESEFGVRPIEVKVSPAPGAAAATGTEAAELLKPGKAPLLLPAPRCHAVAAGSQDSGTAPLAAGPALPASRTASTTVLPAESSQGPTTSAVPAIPAPVAGSGFAVGPDTADPDHSAIPVRRPLPGAPSQPRRAFKTNNPSNS